MVWIFWLLGAAGVAGVALVAVGRTVGRLATTAAPALYQLDEAVAWIADELPDEVTARVSHDDVATVLGWHLDWFGGVGLATEHGEELGDEAVGDRRLAWADLDEAVDAVVARSLAEGGPEPVDVVCILDAQVRYLRRIGALDPVPDD